MKKTYKLAAASAGITAAALTMATPAFAAFSVGTAYGSMDTVNGSATIDRTGLSVLVTIHLSPGSTFASTTANLQICASTQPFTARASGNANCGAVPNGEFASYNETGGASSAMETFNLNPIFNGQTAYLQIHASTLDGGVANTTFACWQDGGPFYGNCAVNNDGTQLPVSAIGGIGAAFVGAGGLALRQRRRRNRSADAAS